MNDFRSGKEGANLTATDYLHKPAKRCPLAESGSLRILRKPISI
jgi:hypothetical protein